MPSDALLPHLNDWLIMNDFIVSQSPSTHTYKQHDYNGPVSPSTQ